MSEKEKKNRKKKEQKKNQLPPFISPLVTAAYPLHVLYEHIFPWISYNGIKKIDYSNLRKSYLVFWWFGFFHDPRFSAHLNGNLMGSLEMKLIAVVVAVIVIVVDDVFVGIILIAISFLQLIYHRLQWSCWSFSLNSFLFLCCHFATQKNHFDKTSTKS